MKSLTQFLSTFIVSYIHVLVFSLTVFASSKQVISADWNHVYQNAQGAIENQEWEKALQFGKESIVLADSLNSDSLMIISHLCVGEALLNQGKGVETFRQYMKGLTIAEQLGSKPLLIRCYHQLSVFYRINKSLQQSTHYKNEQLRLIEETTPIDSQALMTIFVNLEEISYSANNNMVNEDKINYILSFANRHQDLKLKDYVISLYRSHLIEGNKIDKLKQFYLVRYPNEFNLIRETEPLTYARLQSLFYENDDQLDSAIYYFDRAEDIIHEEANLALKANFYIRYGQFAERHQQYKKAIDKYEKALHWAEQQQYLPFAITSSKALENLYSQKGQYKEAFHFGKLTQQFKDSFSNVSRKDELLRMEIENESNKRKLQLEKQDRENQTILTAQKNRSKIIGITGLVILILALALWARLRYTRKMNLVIQKEKEKSDSLLLNILPKGIANELKTNGKVRARDFDAITILFTDFKGFTNISEQLSAQQLVLEINTCFRQFDEITSEFRIEKIKTIGDAYMCAAGFDGNAIDGAKRTILAAIKMQAFIMERFKTLQLEASPAFQMRVGIHTGPVVAGVVGVKKFQYDIWGDTVNIASRLESGGDVNQVNISKETYKLISGDSMFNVEHRGKIEVKGKGKIDMYFVQVSPS